MVDFINRATDAILGMGGSIVAGAGVAYDAAVAN